RVLFRSRSCCAPTTRAAATWRARWRRSTSSPSCAAARSRSGSRRGSGDAVRDPRHVSGGDPRRGLWLLRDNPRVLVGTAAVLYVPVTVLLTELPHRWVTATLAVLLFSLVNAAVTWAVGELYLSRPASVAAALRAVWSLLLP